MGAASPSRGRGAEVPSAMKILCFTWNVGNTMPNEQELGEWLPETGTSDWDLVAIGTQECSFRASSRSRIDLAHSVAQSSGSISEGGDDDVDVPADGESAAPVSKLLSGKAIQKDAYLWDKMVARRLGRGYVVVKHVSLWEMRLTVYVRADWIRKVGARGVYGDRTGWL